MSDHIIKCNGEECDGYECGLCDCCCYDFGDPAYLTTYYDDDADADAAARPLRRLCELCASTPTARVAQRTIVRPEVEVLKTICHVGNAILQALEVGGLGGTEEAWRNRR